MLNIFIIVLEVLFITYDLNKQYKEIINLNNIILEQKSEIIKINSICETLCQSKLYNYNDIISKKYINFSLGIIPIYLISNKLYMVFTALTLPVVIVISYYNLYPICIKKAIPYLIALLIILGLVLINEKINCLNMMKYAKLPYHAIIEIIGMILFTLLSYIFLQTEKYNL